MDVSCHRPFLPGTSLEPAVIPTTQASSFTLQYSPYTCDVPSTAVFCNESIECFPGTASKFYYYYYYSNYYCCYYCYYYIKYKLSSYAVEWTSRLWTHDDDTVKFGRQIPTCRGNLQPACPVPYPARCHTPKHRSLSTRPRENLQSILNTSRSAYILCAVSGTKLWVVWPPFTAATCLS